MDLEWIQQVEAGPWLDQLVLTKVLGYRRDRTEKAYGDYLPYTYWVKDEEECFDECETEDIPSFSTSHEVWRLVVEMRLPKYRFVLERDWDGVYHSAFAVPDKESRFASDESLPLAICRAALLAVFQEDASWPEGLVPF